MEKQKQIEELLLDGELLRELFVAGETRENRGECLADSDVTALLDGLLPREKMGPVFFHLARCEDCLDLLILSHRAVREEAGLSRRSFASILEIHYNRFRRFALVVKNSVENLNPVALAPGFKVKSFPIPCPVRGDAHTKKPSAIVLEKEADPYSFRLEVDRVSRRRNQLQITAKDKTTGRPASKIRMSLLQNGSETDSYVTEGGRVVFEDLSPGRYLINVSMQGDRICEFDLSLI